MRLNDLLKRFNFFNFFFKGFGDCIFSPLDKIAKSFIPKSMPTDLLVLIFGKIKLLNSTFTLTNQRPARVKIFADNNLPFNFEFSFNLISFKCGIFDILPDL